MTDKVVLLGIDLETSGLDRKKDHILEIGYVVKEHGGKRPLAVGANLTSDEGFYNGLTISKEITGINLIEQWPWEKHSEDIQGVLINVCELVETYDVDYVVAHNGTAFDKPWLMEKMEKYAVFNAPAFNKVPWIDTKTDIEYPSHYSSTALIYVAASLGFVNPLPHSALFDVATMLKVLDCFPIEDVIQRSKSPLVILEAQTSYEKRDLAKAARFGWERAGDMHFPKKWVKQVKNMDVAKELARAREIGFEIKIL